MQKSPISLNGILHLVRRFEKAGSSENCPGGGRPTLTGYRVIVVQNVMKVLAVQTSKGNSSVREADRRAGIPE